MPTYSEPAAIAAPIIGGGPARFVRAAANRRHPGAHARIHIARREGDFFHLRRRFHRAQRFDDARGIGDGAELRLQGFIDGNRQEQPRLSSPMRLLSQRALCSMPTRKSTGLSPSW